MNARQLKRGYSLIRKLRGYEQIIDDADSMVALGVLHGEILMLKFMIQQTMSNELIKACHDMYNNHTSPQDRYQDYNWIRWQTMKKHGRNSTAWAAAKRFIDKLESIKHAGIPY